MSISCIIMVIFGILGLVFGMWRYHKEQRWYQNWHDAFEAQDYWYRQYLELREQLGEKK